MRHRVKLIALVTLIVFALVIFGAGCGSSTTATTTTTRAQQSGTTTASTSSGSSDPITITVMFSDHPSQPYQAETWVLPKVAKEKFNITMEMQAIPSSGFLERRNTTLASGDIPDIIIGMEKLVADDYGKRGMFLNFMKYKDIMPNMMIAFEKYEPLSIHMPGPDEFYVMPGQCVTIGSVGVAANSIPLVRKDILDDLGLDTPNTYDELYNMLSEMKKAYPDSYPWIDRTRLTFGFSAISAGLGLNSFPRGACNTGWTVFNPATETFSDVLEEENFKFFIDFMRKCYTDGLLDPNYATDTTTEWEAKLMSSRGFFTLDYFSRPDMMTNIARQGGDTKFNLEAMLPPAIEGGVQKTFANLGVGGFNVVSAKTRNPERICEFIDYWVYTEEGSLLMNYGIEGKTYNVSPDKKLSLIFTDTINSKLDHDAAYGTNYLTFWSFKPDFYGYDTFDATASYNYQQPWLLYKDNLLDPPPAIAFNSQELDRLNEYRVDLNETRLEFLNQFIMGEKPMSQWDAAIKELHDIGMADFLDLINETYKRIYK